jgi:DNA polymerase I
MASQDLAALLRQAGAARGSLVGLAGAADGRAAVAVASPAGSAAGPPVTTGWIVPARDIAKADTALRPRWVTWDGATAAALVRAGVRLATCWDIAAVHRLLFGGWEADPGLAWASVHGLRLDGIPAQAPGELFAALDDGGLPGDGAADEPVGAGGYLRGEWVAGGWADSEPRLLRWAGLAVAAALRQAAMLRGRPQAPPGGTTAPGLAWPPPSGRLPAGATVAHPDAAAREASAHCESTAQLLCAELEADGLPMDRATAERLLTGIIGRRPRDVSEAARIRAARDQRVLRLVPGPARSDLRSPAQVKALLKSVGIDVPDTRAWRLEQVRDAHPVVPALLEWRKTERIATTYGYAWLDACLGPDGRLRGSWTGSDGAAGRMTASAGLHNMPAVLRQAVIAEDGHVLVRADLGQIEPRVLAAVSGDPALIAATAADDLYLPVARQLNVDRPTAKVAMIAAMYGQTTGHGGQAARRMKAAYPVAMAYLDEADRQAQAGRDLRTHGGRLVPMPGGQEPEPAARVAARGRYGRNAMIQGAAAELFKMWAVTVRARAAPTAARIVLCLHDELLLHVPQEEAADAASLVGGCLRETAVRWAPGSGARFLADIAAVRCWAAAKPAVAGVAGPAVAGD